MSERPEGDAYRPSCSFTSAIPGCRPYAATAAETGKRSVLRETANSRDSRSLLGDSAPTLRKGRRDRA